MKIVLRNLTKIFPSRNKKSNEEVVAVNNNSTLPTVLDTMKTTVLQKAYETDESIESILKDAQALAEAEAF